MFVLVYFLYMQPVCVWPLSVNVDTGWQSKFHFRPTEKGAKRHPIAMVPRGKGNGIVGMGFGGQWEGKQNKFMLRRGGNWRCGSRKRDIETKEEAANAREGQRLNRGWTFWGKHTNLFGGEWAPKCIGQEINIPRLNEQLLHSWGMSIYEGLQVSDLRCSGLLFFLSLPLSVLQVSFCSPIREEAFKGWTQVRQKKGQPLKKSLRPGPLLNIEAPYCSQGLI